jgi:hypothetical protein
LASDTEGPTLESVVQTLTGLVSRMKTPVIQSPHCYF